MRSEGPFRSGVVEVRACLKNLALGDHPGPGALVVGDRDQCVFPLELDPVDLRRAMRPADTAPRDPAEEELNQDGLLPG